MPVSMAAEVQSDASFQFTCSQRFLRRRLTWRAVLMGTDIHRKRKQNKGPQFVQLFNYVIDSPAYRGLSPTARAALVEFARLYNGSNNGFLAMPVRILAARLGVSKTTAARVLLELEEAGFIEVVKVGAFRRKDRMASEYRLTFHRCDASGTAPSRAFQKVRQGANGFKSVSSGPVGGTVVR